MIGEDLNYLLEAVQDFKAKYGKTFELALLQMLSLNRLSVTKPELELPDLQKIASSAKPKEQLKTTYSALENDSRLGESSMAFTHASEWLTEVADRELMPLLLLANGFQRLPQLVRDFATGLIESACLKRNLTTMPRELARLLCALAGELEGKSVYCPYSQSLPCAFEAVGSAANVVIDGEISPFGHLFKLLTDTSVDIRAEDPILSPRLDETGGLARFDVSLGGVGFGRNYRDELGPDPFGRFRFGTSQSASLQVQHILAVTNEVAAVVVPQSLLFQTTEREKKWKESL